MIDDFKSQCCDANVKEDNGYFCLKCGKECTPTRTFIRGKDE